MIDYLIDIDTQLMLWANGFHADILDPLMRIISDRWTWVPFYVALAAFIIKYFGWKRGLIIIIAVCFAVACSDLLCAKVIRPQFARLRPANLDNPISQYIHIVDGYRGGLYGFPSCHAANSFALAVSSALLTRWRTYSIVIMAWALLQCYTRIYLGVHYPGDIIVGAAIGASIGALVWLAAWRINPRD